jgi:hypothetical protein
MRIPLGGVTPDHLKQADAIAALDPVRPSYRQEIWGPGVAPSARALPADHRTLVMVDVEIDSTQDGQLQDLLRRVESAKGYLHPKIAALKR